MPHAVSAQGTPFFFRVKEYPKSNPVNFILILISV